MEIERVVSDANWSQLFVDFAERGLPCILSSEATLHWPVFSRWITSDGHLNYEYLESAYGDDIVPVLVEGACEPRTETFREFLHYVKEFETVDSEGQPVKYLKDWHFQQRHGMDLYSPPRFLLSDWPNEETLWNEEESLFHGDYRFVYFGVKGSWTPLHSDVVASFSWSANVCGRKLWFMMAPGQERHFMRDGQLVSDMRTFPEEVWKEARVMVFNQMPGEVVFVPSHWHHQVHNLETTISINHNVVGASNVRILAKFIQMRREAVVRELHEFGVEQDFNGEELKQKYEEILTADARLNVADLRRLLATVIHTRSSFTDAICWVCPHHSWKVEECKESEVCRAEFVQSVNLFCCCSQDQNMLLLSLDKISDAQIEEMLQGMLKGEQYKGDLDLETVSRLLQVLKVVVRERSLEMLRNVCAKEEDYNRLRHLLSPRLSEDNIKWQINVVIANSLVEKKSFHPIVEMEIHGQKLECNLEKFAKLRLSLARGLRRLESVHSAPASTSELLRRGGAAVVPPKS